jgi:hypothetical protein
VGGTAHRSRAPVAHRSARLFGEFTPSVVVRSRAVPPANTVDASDQREDDAMTQQPTTPERHPQQHAGERGRPSPWAAGGTVFAGVVLLVDGLLDILKGITAIATDDIYGAINNYVFHFNLTGWGWVLVVLGVIAVVTGLGLLTDALWARVLGVFMASLSLVANFLWLPYQPLWAVISIGLDAWVIWALTAHRPVRSTAV